MFAPTQHNTTKELHARFKEINQIHPTLKFTINHTTPKHEAQEDRCNFVSQNSIQFLDTSISIEGGRIEPDLFKKETDRNQYLLRESCHPNSVTASILFSRGLRITRICSNKEIRNTRLEELSTVLLERGTAVQQGLSKYLTAKDTHISPTSTNQSRTLSSHVNLLSLQSQSTIQEYKTFSVPSLE